MNRSTALTIASMPAVAGLAWRNHRRAERVANAHHPLAPDLPGERRTIRTDWGYVSYRLIREGRDTSPSLVLIHGWGKTGDTAWWPIIENCRSSMVVIDLPGHGHSPLNDRFSLELAATALVDVIADSGVTRPILVAHSMGGPVAFTAIREQGPASFSGLVALATSAYWVTPRVRAMMALAPYAMSPRSPVLTRTKAREVSKYPARAPEISWSYTRRPMLNMLRQGASALRRFDASRWTGFELPDTQWVVPTEDRVLPPQHQLSSAHRFGATVHEIEAGHSVVMDAPARVVEILNRLDQSRPDPTPHEGAPTD